MLLNSQFSTLNLLDIVEDTMVDGPGFRTSIYCAGCAHACPGCHNPQSWDFAGGHRVSIEEVMKVIEADPYANVTFSGGDPFYQAEAFAELARTIKARTNKTIWCYTGFTWEELVPQVATAPRVATAPLGPPNRGEAQQREDQEIQQWKEEGVGAPMKASPLLGGPRGASSRCFASPLSGGPRGAGGTVSLLSYLDVLVDGPFIAALRNPDLRFRGSSNQRIIDVQASLKAGRCVLLNME